MSRRSGGGKPWWSDAGIGAIFEVVGTVLEALLEALASGLFH